MDERHTSVRASSDDHPLWLRSRSSASIRRDARPQGEWALEEAGCPIACTDPKGHCALRNSDGRLGDGRLSEVACVWTGI
jgi:hypothetical protein